MCTEKTAIASDFTRCVVPVGKPWLVCRTSAANGSTTTLNGLVFLEMSRGWITPQRRLLPVLSEAISLILAAVPTNCGDSNAKQSPDGDARRLRDDSRVFLDHRDKGKSSQELNRGVWQSEVRLDAVFICENNAAVGVDRP